VTPGQWREIDRVLKAALACDPEARRDLIARECEGDASLRYEVESLLHASSCADEFLDAPLVQLDRFEPRRLDDGARSSDRDSQIPKHIGAYRIIRRLGAGGMGVVYLAEQANPQRLVAIKVMRSDAAGQATARFRREADALARLKHPGIAHIYEAGQADVEGERRAYIAMEYVAGRSLKAYVLEQAPPLHDRLALFTQICDSVQHAHQKSVVHRDLKPANIMVPESERSTNGAPVAKVLDFGVARFVDDDDAALTLSSPAHILGTLPYMSPEQVGGAGHEVDTRTDIYALGVIGYEMLSGELPYDVRGAPPAEIIRRISEASPRSLRGGPAHIDNDLETIFRKALEKDPQRRYTSAAALADDVRRYLRAEPITARPPSAIHQLRLLARRRLGLFIGAVVAVSGLTIGASLALWKAIETGHERDRAVRAEQLAEQRLAAATAAEAEARRESATAAAVTDFLRKTFAAADPESSSRANTTLREALDYAAERIDSDFRDQPEVEAQVRGAIANTYRSLGAFDEAGEHLVAAMSLTESISGRDTIAFSHLLFTLGALERDRGHNDASERALRECLATRRAILPAVDEGVASSQAALATTLTRLGRHEEALALHESALATRRALYGDEHTLVADSLAAMAISQRFLSQFRDAEQNNRTALRIYEQTLGADHPRIAVARHNLARVLNELGQYEDAVALIADAIASMRRIHTTPHPHTAQFLASYGDTLRNLGRDDDAEASLLEALAMQRALYPDGCLDQLKTLVALAELPKYRNDVAGSLPLENEAEALADAYGSDDDKFALTALRVRRQLNAGALESAGTLAMKRLEDVTARCGADHPNVANARLTLAEVRLAQDRLPEALSEVETSLGIRRRAFGDDHPQTAIAVSNLALIHRRMGHTAEAGRLFADAMESKRRLLGADHHETRDTTFQYAWLLCESGASAKGEPLVRESMRLFDADPSAAAAERLSECALLLQLVANTSEAPSTYDADIDNAIARARQRLGDEHAYLAQVIDAIHRFRASAREAGAD